MLSNHPSKTGSQESIHAGFECLQRRLRSLSAQPVPMLCHPHTEEILPCVSVELAVFQPVSTVSCPVAAQHSFVSHSLGTYSDEIPPQSSLLQAEQPALSAFPHWAPDHLRGSLLDSLHQLPAFLELGSPELDTVLQAWPHQGSIEGEDHLPRPAGHTLFNTPQLYAQKYSTEGDAGRRFLVTLQLKGASSLLHYSSLWHLLCHRTIEWLLLERTLNPTQLEPPAMSWLPPTSSGCPGLPPTMSTSRDGASTASLSSCARASLPSE